MTALKSTEKRRPLISCRLAMSPSTMMVMVTWRPM